MAKAGPSVRCALAWGLSLWRSQDTQKLFWCMAPDGSDQHCQIRVRVTLPGACPPSFLSSCTESHPVSQQYHPHFTER